MPHRRDASLFRLALLATTLGMGPAAVAQLTTNSPFLPPATAGSSSATPTGNAGLEYLGYREIGAGREFRLRDPARKTSVWLRLNETNGELGVTPRRYDEGGEALTVEFQGRTLALPVRRAKIIAAPSAPMPQPVMPAPANMSPAVTQSVALNPTPADEQRRLEAVAAEVARRRSLREQATQQTPAAPGGAPTPAGATPPPQPQPR